jgi:hypothetical protein
VSGHGLSNGSIKTPKKRASPEACRSNRTTLGGQWRGFCYSANQAAKPLGETEPFLLIEELPKLEAATMRFDGQSTRMQR